jgi:hypothetical protein
MTLPLLPLFTGIIAAPGVSQPPPAPTPTPGANNISPLRILNPASLAANRIAVSAGVASAFNLLKASPKEVWSHTVFDAFVDIDIDLGRDIAIDTVWLAYTLSTPSATWSLLHGTAVNGAAVNPEFSGRQLWSAVDAEGPRVHAIWHRSAGTILARYLKIKINQPADALLPEFQVGALMVGASLRFQYSYEYDNGREVVDLSARQELSNGDIGGAIYARTSIIELPMGDLTDIEMRALYMMMRARGLMQPFGLIENIDATSHFEDGAHYCVYESLDKYLRRGFNQVQYKLRVRQVR